MMGARSFAIGHTACSADLISSSSIIAGSLRATSKPSAETTPFQAINKMKYVVQKIYKIDEWSQMIEKICVRHQKAPVIMIHYLRKVKAESNRMDERLRVDEILPTLTNMAKDHNIPVLVISELARDSYKTGQRLSMASFKESGSIEYDEASWLGILAAVEEDWLGYGVKNDWERIVNHDGNIDLIVFKAKRGTGATGRISLKLDKSKMIVRDRIESTKTDVVTGMCPPRY
jgi:replicative DNA helicase